MDRCDPTLPVHPQLSVIVMETDTESSRPFAPCRLRSSLIIWIAEAPLPGRHATAGGGLVAVSLVRGKLMRSMGKVRGVGRREWLSAR